MGVCGGKLVGVGWVGGHVMWVGVSQGGCQSGWVCMCVQLKGKKIRLLFV